MARFPYYRNLSAAQKRIYDASDRVVRVPLKKQELLAPYVDSLEKCLAGGDRKHIADAAGRLIAELASHFRVPPIRVKVLDRRPDNSGGELHGLYEAHERSAVITVWMRTAKKRQIVKFKTFLRTLVHEFMHHLDYTALALEDSFHTEGFFKRESDLARQLLGERMASAKRSKGR